MIKKIMKLIFKEIFKKKQKNKDQTLRVIRLNIE